VAAANSYSNGGGGGKVFIGWWGLKSDFFRIFFRFFGPLTVKIASFFNLNSQIRIQIVKMANFSIQTFKFILNNQF
jgi:hypothetical protein